LSTGRSSWSPDVAGAPAAATDDFAWTSHSASYGFSTGSNADWHPDRAALAKQIRSFLADIDPKTGYLRE
jgi:hypothetical protein